MSSITYADNPPAWGAVFSMSLGIFGIVAAEFLPASLLTPMAHGLQVTEGVAGQAVSVTAVLALVTSLLVSAVSGRMNRRKVLISFTFLLVLSNLLVAVAPNMTMVLLARMLLGIALGGFWALAAATIMRLVAEKDVPKALGILFAGVSAATVFAAPFGSYFGDLFGWRAVFLAAAGLGVVALVAQYVTLPSMPSQGTTRLATLFTLFSRPSVGLGMLSILLVFTGHFGFFTYLRPFLEEVTMVNPVGVTLILLIFGVGAFVGNSLSSILIARSIRTTFIAMPFIMGMLAILLATLGGFVAGNAVMIAIWGILFGIVPVTWSTWVTRTVPDEAESAGGLLVATVQLAITFGAAGGGLIFDIYGARSVFLVSAAVLAFGGIAALKVRTMH